MPTRVDSVARIGAAIAALILLGFLLTRWISPFVGGDVVYDAESEFGRVRVVDGADGVRSLYVGPGRARQTAIVPGRPRHLVSEYARVAMIGLALTPAGGRILYVGLGGGAMPTYTRAVFPSARIEVVEIDPVIVDVARRYFDVRPDSNLVVHTGDGRAFIEGAAQGTYDLIVLDAFSDDAIPIALATREFLAAVRTALAADGVVVSNLWSSSPLYPSMLATYDAIFDEVHSIRVGRTIQRIIIAGDTVDGMNQEDLEAAAGRLTSRVDLGFDLSDLVRSGYEGVAGATAPVLSDSDS
ncbi:MAG: fused MFS/spermidine synthase [Gemmatimonadota bacterium]